MTKRIFLSVGGRVSRPSEFDSSGQKTTAGRRQEWKHDVLRRNRQMVHRSSSRRPRVHRPRPIAVSRKSRWDCHATSTDRITRGTTGITLWSPCVLTLEVLREPRFPMHLRNISDTVFSRSFPQAQMFYPRGEKAFKVDFHTAFVFPRIHEARETDLFEAGI